MKKAVVIGGDSRQFYLAQYLEAGGLEVEMLSVQLPENETRRMSHSCLEELVLGADIIALPIPVSQDGNHIKGMKDETLTDVAQYVTEGQRLYGGLLPLRFIKACEKRGCSCFDYMKSDTIAVENAVATAEGAIAELIQQSNINLHGSQVLVIGYGRCGKVLCQKLHGLHAQVTVMARREEVRAEAEAIGLRSLPMFGDCTDIQLGRYDFVINTVPAPTLTWENLGGLRQDVIILDIASAPGGTDFTACKELGLTASLSLGIPGRYASKTSGQILGNQILSEMYAP